MTTVTYQVSGMTCGHCVQAVSREVGALPGVEAVDVDLVAGVVRVTSRQELPADSVREAVDEAGYELVG
jgi:copper ion binding protein